MNGSGQKTGPSILLKVMSGDKIDIAVQTYYNAGTNSTQNPSVTDVLNSLANGVVTMAGGAKGSVSDLNNTTTSPIYAALNSFLAVNEPNTGSTKPKAYLNWILLDEQLKYVSSYPQSGGAPVGASGTLNTIGYTGLPITKNGYLYIWVSNETQNWDVFFDNLSIKHYTGPLVEETHYYPFGLTMAGISSKALKPNYAENKFKFNGGVELQNKEFSDGSGLELYETLFRGYDPQIGRFWQIDPLADINENWSPYAFAVDNPILVNDPFGLDSTTRKTDLDEVVVTAAKKTPPKTPDVAGSVGPAPSNVPEPIPNLHSGVEHDRSVMLFGYDLRDPDAKMQYELEHTAVTKPTFWEGLTNDINYDGRNVFGDKVFNGKIYGGTAPSSGSFNRIKGIAELFSIRSSRSWEELFEWGHKFDILKKLKAVSTLDIVRLKNAGVTVEQLKTWSSVYGAAVIKKATSSNVIAKYRLDYINKLIELW